MCTGTEEIMYTCPSFRGLPQNKERGARARKILGRGSEMLNFDYLKRRAEKWLQREGRSFGVTATMKISIIWHRRVVGARELLDLPKKA